MSIQTFQDLGAQYQCWIENPPNPDDGCRIKPFTFKLEDLDESFADTAFDGYNTEELRSVVEEVMGIKAPPHEKWRTIERKKVDPDAEPSPDASLCHLHSWEGHIGPGIIYIENMFRKPGAGSEAGPHSSQMAQAAYESVYPIHTLEHIVVSDVVNKETKRFVKRQLYTDHVFEDTELEWPTDQLVRWGYDTWEYKSLLGTQIGAVVSRILLGAFKRGTRRISRIYTVAHYGNCLFMRFDIETIEPGRPTIKLVETDKRKHDECDSTSDVESKRKRKRDESDDVSEVESKRKRKRDEFEDVSEAESKRKRKRDECDDVSEVESRTSKRKRDEFGDVSEGESKKKRKSDDEGSDRTKCRRLDN
ncbi:hypothetical protein N7520_003327 [Penicillium odoratum]|uniref:uncharacterized protein n=1 Tax=Penicillium odoratum TaxID=1167516 RepID=UPI0025488D2E|nr:uncharacterized protein N7520_003327 [Penicillium odoratum]KAJ5768768.1 hypothetical protein N7520_003327 [Penicillium odoratum]